MLAAASSGMVRESQPRRVGIREGTARSRGKHTRAVNGGAERRVRQRCAAQNRSQLRVRAPRGEQAGCQIVEGRSHRSHTTERSRFEEKLVDAAVVAAGRECQGQTGSEFAADTKSELMIESIQ